MKNFILTALSVIFSILRVVFAALLAFGAMLATVGVIAAHYGESKWPWWASLPPAAAMFAGMFIAMYVFNRSWFRPRFPRKSLSEHIAELEGKGLVLRTSFQATRSFAVEEFEDEGSHYFIGLVDGSVLYLNGQYLYDYEPISDGPELNQPRQFPCTEFEILRHKNAGYVLDIKRSGAVLEPEVVAPPFGEEVWGRNVPEDGDIIRDRSYETLMWERTAA